MCGRQCLTEKLMQDVALSCWFPTGWLKDRKAALRAVFWPMAFFWIPLCMRWPGSKQRCNKWAMRKVAWFKISSPHLWQCKSNLLMIHLVWNVFGFSWISRGGDGSTLATGGCCENLTRGGRSPWLHWWNSAVSRLQWRTARGLGWWAAAAVSLFYPSCRIAKGIEGCTLWSEELQPNRLESAPRTQISPCCLWASLACWAPVKLQLVQLHRRHGRIEALASTTIIMVGDLWESQMVDIETFQWHNSNTSMGAQKHTQDLCHCQCAAVLGEKWVWTCRHWARTVVWGEVSWLPFKGNVEELNQSITSLSAKSWFALKKDELILGSYLSTKPCDGKGVTHDLRPTLCAKLRPRWAACTWWVMRRVFLHLDSL